METVPADDGAGCFLHARPLGLTVYGIILTVGPAICRLAGVNAPIIRLETQSDASREASRAAAFVPGLGYPADFGSGQLHDFRGQSAAPSPQVVPLQRWVLRCLGRIDNQ